MLVGDKVSGFLVMMVALVRLLVADHQAEFLVLGKLLLVMLA